MIQRWTSKFELKPGTWVFVPTTEAVIKGREIKRAIEERWKKPPSYYYHLRNGGHVAALQSHTGNTSFIHLDIKNFFGSINRTRVTRSLKKMFAYPTAREWANYSTVVDPKHEKGILKYILPFGFVQSPMIASLCLRDSALGACLERLHRRGGITISVYVDDLIISTNDEIISNHVLAEIKHATQRAGFVLNTDKEEGPAASITAFNIELSHKSLLVEPARLEAFWDAILKADSTHQAEGIIGYIRSVNRAQVESMASRLPAPPEI